jgi:hypothetical protein
MTTLIDWAEQRDQAMQQVEHNANESLPAFSVRAEQFILEYLRYHGETSGEALTDACKRSGITPHDDRAFGPVYGRLAKQKLIEVCGTCVRTKGHGTRGGNIWRLVTE